MGRVRDAVWWRDGEEEILRARESGFHYPAGRPEEAVDVEAGLKSLAALSIANGGLQTQLQRKNIPDVLKALGLPLYWKEPVWSAAGGKKGWVGLGELSSWWRQLCQVYHSEAARFVAVIKGRLAPLTRQDFEPMIQDIVDSFPGFDFLRLTPEFHSRYVQTVIARIFFSLDRSWSKDISLNELRRSNFLQTVRSLETVEDINLVSDYFSYKHFYVIYCKFCEIDRDQDLFISKAELAEHANGALSAKIIERVFSGAVRPPGSPPDRMSYSEFVAFFLAEEDKKQDTSLEYWFRCMDLEGDGRLSIYEMEYFYGDIAAKMVENNEDPMPFNDLLCQVLDIVKPANEGFVTLRDIRRSGMGAYFFNSFINIHKHYDQESELKLPEWDRYCQEEYEYLMSQAAEETELAVESDEDGGGKPEAL